MKQIDCDNKSKAIWCAAKATCAAIMGVLSIFFFGACAFAIVSHYRVSTCSSLYEDRELEILSYRKGPNSTSDDPMQIRGSIIPDGIEVYTDDNAISLMSLNDSDSLIQMAPSEKSVIGKRIRVKYFVGKDEDRRWWHPHQVYNHVQYTGRSLIYMWLMTIFFLGATVTCFVYTYRKNREFEPLAKYLSGDEP